MRKTRDCYHYPFCTLFWGAISVTRQKNEIRGVDIRIKAKRSIFAHYIIFYVGKKKTRKSIKNLLEIIIISVKAGGLKINTLKSIVFLDFQQWSIRKYGRF